MLYRGIVVVGFVMMACSSGNAPGAPMMMGSAGAAPAGEAGSGADDVAGRDSTLAPIGVGGAASVAGAGGAAGSVPMSAGAGAGGAAGSAGAGLAGQPATAGRAPTAGTSAAGTTSCAARFVDADGDGWGSDEVAPCDADAAATAARDGDCDDDEPLAHPGQTEYFDAPMAGGSFDYDCDGEESLDRPEIGRCPDTTVTPTVPGSVGWVRICAQPDCAQVLHEAPPACGDEGMWKQNAAACQGTTIRLRLSCR